MKEKIISGQVFMYRTGGIPATCYSYKMKDAVDKNILQKAVDTALTRYPYFRSRAVEEQGDYFLIDNDLPFIVHDEVIPLGAKEADYYLVGVCVQDNNIIFSMHHGLCDGCGFAPFMNTVLYYYVIYLYNIKIKVPGIRLSDSQLMPTEMSDPYDVKYEVTEDAGKKGEEKAFVLPETTISYEKHYRWRVTLKADEFYNFSHKYETGVSAVISYMMSRAISNIFPDEEHIVASLASDARLAVNMPDTFKNCLDGIELPYKGIFKDMDIETIFTIYTGITLAQKQPENVIPRIVRSQMLSKYLDKCPDLESKRQMMKFTDQLTVNTFLVSYLGRTNLGEIERYIEHAEVYGVGTHGLIIEVMSVNNAVTLSIMQNFETDKYVNEFIKIAEEYGLKTEIENIGEFETPRCEIK